MDITVLVCISDRVRQENASAVPVVPDPLGYARKEGDKCCIEGVLKQNRPAEALPSEYLGETKFTYKLPEHGLIDYYFIDIIAIFKKRCNRRVNQKAYMRLRIVFPYGPDRRQRHHCIADPVHTPDEDLFLFFFVFRVLPFHRDILTWRLRPFRKFDYLRKHVIGFSESQLDSATGNPYCVTRSAGSAAPPHSNLIHKEADLAQTAGK